MYDSEEDKEQNAGSPSSKPRNRKKRGLKILSVKVQELVYSKDKTTYKDVANELIKQLRDSGETSMGEMLRSFGPDLFGDEDDEGANSGGGEFEESSFEGAVESKKRKKIG
mmetsp:Transcript_12986/g.9399  ORF Transcript_12986/g.9399 Transcript_12986/m.9399 type:complete len:111 (+) Transcript_12986:171-503(+)